MPQEVILAQEDMTQEERPQEVILTEDMPQVPILTPEMLKEFVFARDVQVVILAQEVTYLPGLEYNINRIGNNIFEIVDSCKRVSVTIIIGHDSTRFTEIYWEHSFSGVINGTDAIHDMDLPSRAQHLNGEARGWLRDYRERLMEHPAYVERMQLSGDNSSVEKYVTSEQE